MAEHVDTQHVFTTAHVRWIGFAPYVILSFIAPHHISNKGELQWLYIYADVSEALARAYKLHTQDFFCRYTFGGLVPPFKKYQKAGYATAFHKSWIRRWIELLITQNQN